jgi:hypothetical protein
MTPWFKPIRLAIFISVASISWAVANAGEIDIYRDIMLGGVADRSDPPPSRVLPYGNNPTPEFPPKILVKPRTVEALNSFCVRSCDGRYFPADQQSRAEGCKNLCPASEMKVFSGNSIDSATTREGKPYSALPNAFRYRKELVPGCTCNGKDSVGLAAIRIEDDKTLRKGDIVANENGLEVVNRVGNGSPGFSAASRSIKSKFERFPVVASQ